MSSSSIPSQLDPYPSTKAVILHLIEKEILESRFKMLVSDYKPCYPINVLIESAVLLLLGFEEKDLQGELYGYYRGLMEQILAQEINLPWQDQPKWQAAKVYEALLERKHRQI